MNDNNTPYSAKKMILFALQKLSPELRCSRHFSLGQMDKFFLKESSSYVDVKQHT